MAGIVKPLIICVTGKKKSGKTTFICALVRELARRGFRTATAKHDVHGFDMDHEGKDTWLHKQAGAAGTAVIGPDKTGLVLDTENELTLDNLAQRFYSDMDILIAEGFYRSGKPRFETFRAAAHATPLPSDQGGELLALVADGKEWLNLDDEWKTAGNHLEFDQSDLAADMITALLKKQ